MPPVVLKHILKSQREFVNGSRETMIAKNSLMALREQGGLGLLDIEARNDAILLVESAALFPVLPELHAATVTRDNKKIDAKGWVICLIIFLVFI